MAGAPPVYQRTAVLQQIGVRRADRSAEQSALRVAAIASQVGDLAFQEYRKQVLEKAEQDGTTAGMARDGEGRLTFQPVDSTSEAARAYNRGAKASYLASFANDVAKKGADLTNQHAADPEGFQRAWSSHVEGTVQGVPENMRADALLHMERLGAQQYTSLLNQRTQQDRTLQHTTLNTQLKSLDSDLLSLARAGKVNAPEYTRAAEARQGLIRDMIGARFITKELGDEMNRGLAGEVSAQAFIGDVMGGYKRRGGGPDAARWAMGEADKIVNDPEAMKDLSPGQRERFRNLLQGEVREAESTRQIGWSELDRKFGQLNDDIAYGVVPQGLSTLKAEAGAMGHKELVTKIERVQQVGQAAAAFTRKSLPDQATEIAQLEERWQKGELNQTERGMFMAYSRAHERALREVKADPVRYAMRSQGDTAAADRITPLQFDDLAALPAQLQRRAAQMRVAGGRIGVAMPLLTKEEGQVIASAVTAPDDPTAAETATRRFEMIRPILSSTATPDQLSATRKALTEAGVKEDDLIAAAPETVQRLGVSGARRMFTALAVKKPDPAGDTKKTLDADIADTWRKEGEFSRAQFLATGDGTFLEREQRGAAMFKRLAYAYGDAGKAFADLRGGTVPLTGDGFMLRIPSDRAGDELPISKGLAALREDVADQMAGGDQANRNRLSEWLRTGTWVSRGDGSMELYVDGRAVMLPNSGMVRTTLDTATERGRAVIEGQRQRSLGWQPVDTTVAPGIGNVLDKMFPKPDEPVSAALIRKRFAAAMKESSDRDDARMASVRNVLEGFIDKVTTPLTREQAADMANEAARRYMARD